MRRRKQAYHKDWVPLGQREKFVNQWAPVFAGFRRQFDQGEISAPAFCAAVINQTWRDLFPTSWANGVREMGHGELDGFEPTLRVFLGTRFRGLPEAVPRTLMAWASGRFPLRLYFHELAADEVLELQSQGHRCVSLLLSVPEILQFEHEGRDFLSFLIHDLVHADHMMKDPVSFARQVRFSEWMWNFRRHLTCTSMSLQQMQRFEYIAADMNSHFVHLLKTLKALLDEVGRTELSEALFLSQPRRSEEFESMFQNLNSPNETGELHRKLLALWDRES